MSEEEPQGPQPPKPREEHFRLKPFEGTFAAVVKIWMGPGEPMQSSGTMVSSFHLDGLYLHQDYVGDKNDGPFPNFVGKGYWGFNTATEEYEGFWIDNASTTMQLEKGHYDDDTKSWEMKSEISMPGMVMKKRTVITLVDDNHHKMEAYLDVPDRGEVKNMEISYTRK